jgi:hypothetical protein
LFAFLSLLRQRLLGFILFKGLNMTPSGKLLHMILLSHQECNPGFLDGVVITSENVEEIYDQENDDCALQDATSEMRCSGTNTGLPAPYSRHYESDAVAKQYIDGSWVGWTYWYGGGKHGEPESLDWIEDAYDVNCAEEEKMVVVRTFTKSVAA